MYGCLGEGGFLILLSSTVGINGDFDRDLDLDLLLDDDDDEEELELELDRDECDEELDEDLMTTCTINNNPQSIEMNYTLKSDVFYVVMMI